MEKEGMKRTKKHVNSMLLRVLLSAFSAVAILTLSLLVVYIFTFRVTVEQEFRQLVQTSVSNIEGAFSQYVNNANAFCRNFYSSTDGIRLRMEDEYKMAFASSLRYDIHESFEVMPFAHSVCVVDRNNQLKGYVTNNNKKLYTNDFENLLPPTLDESPGQIYPILWTVSNAHASNQEFPILTFYMRAVSPESEKYSGTITVNLEARALSQSLFVDMTSEGTEYFVINHEGCIVAHNNPNRCGEDLSGESYIQKILNGCTQFQNITADGVEYQIYATPASVANFYIVAQSEYLSELNRSKTSILMIVLITIVIDLVVAISLYTICCYIFKPFNSIVRRVKQSELLADANTLHDDIAVLNQYHNEVSSYVEHLKEKEGKNQIVKAMLKRKNVDFLLLQHGYIQSDAPYYLLLLHIGKEHDDVVQLTEYDRIRTDLEMICLEYLNLCTCFEVGFRRIMVLVSGPEGTNLSLEEVKNTVAAIQSKISESYNLQSTAYVSERISSDLTDRTCTDVYHLGDSRLKTYRFLDPKTQTALISETETSRNWKSYMDAALLQTRRQDKDLFVYNLEQMFGALQYHPWGVFSQAVLKLATEIIKIRNTEDLSVDYTRALAEKVGSITDCDRLCSWLTELFDDTSSWMQTINDHSSVPVMEKMVSYIESHYSDRDLNLNMLAKQMHISAPYLGKLFHNFTGTSFNGYLTQVRMERARELLLMDRDASISAIASEVGYSNSSYFTTTFKNYYGVNPSTYRSQKEEPKQP